MLSVDDALKQVLAQAQRLPAVAIPTRDALGRTLAEDVASDVDSPPHDKAVMDGYAVVASDLSGGSAELTVIEEITAGTLPTQRVTPGAASRIMTGAPLPDGADAVVVVEQSESLDGGRRVRLTSPKIAAGQNIMRRAESMHVGQTVLSAGQTLRPIDVGLLAEVGRTTVQVVRRPQVAVLATGNELVPANERPQPGFIRNSNSPMIVALAHQAGADAIDLGIGRDDRAALQSLVERGLAADVLILSGGVSAGVLDLVPSVLAAAEVEAVFHKVEMKPGKPLWFGVRRDGERRTLVFGLPGNPASSYVCFALFVQAALRGLAGDVRPALATRPAKLAVAYRHKGGRPTFHPSTLVTMPDGDRVTPLDWQGSADLAGLARANALACFPAEERSYAAGDTIAVRPIE